MRVVPWRIPVRMILSKEVWKKTGKIVITARAFTPLVKILDYVCGINCRLFLLKGREVENEIAVAKQKYRFGYNLIPSKTGDGFITIIDFDR